jgi:flavin reductase (DIM6/NTAB) family NADH-FMN oxidoreductase RutF
MSRSIDSAVFAGLVPEPRQVAAAREALLRLPQPVYLMSAQFEGKRAGLFVRSLQVVADEPLLLAVAVRKGHPIDPIIRDAHAFAVGVVDPSDRLLARKFGSGASVPPLEESAESSTHPDPFDCLPIETLVTGAPVVRRCLVAFDCVVVRHLDLEADHELFVGQVFAGRIYNEPRPTLFLPEALRGRQVDRESGEPIAPLH